jgi:hypothetical protein
MKMNTDAVKTLDTNAFEKAFRDALSGFAPEANARASRKAGELGEAAMLFDAKAISLTSFCASWPRVKGFLLMVMSGAGWFFPAQVALAKAFLTAFEATILPVVCPVPPAE